LTLLKNGREQREKEEIKGWRREEMEGKEGKEGKGDVRGEEVNVAYVRVSVAEENPENQIQAIRRFVGNDKEVKFFVDVGVSGAVPPERRKGFAEMLKFIDAVRTVYGDVRINLFVYEVSRLGRNFLETLNLIHKFEHELGVRILSVSEKEQFMNIQEGSIRNLILSILAWVADREREVLRERTKEGMRRAKAEGKRISRSRIELTAKQIRKIKQYREMGLNLSAIAKLIGVSVSTLRRRLIELGMYGKKEEEAENEQAECK